MTEHPPRPKFLKVFEREDLGWDFDSTRGSGLRVVGAEMLVAEPARTAAVSAVKMCWHCRIPCVSPWLKSQNIQKKRPKSGLRSIIRSQFQLSGLCVKGEGPAVAGPLLVTTLLFYEMVRN